MNKNKFSLINHEGDVLWAKRDNDKVVIYDQWDELVDIISVELFCTWIDGEIGLTDTKGKAWFWNKEHRDTKPSMWKLLNFLK